MINIAKCDTSHIYKEIENDILLLNLKPGDMISENYLCDKYQVSRTPIRNVLSRLSQAGLVDITPKSGSRVSRLNIYIVKEIIFERIAIESMVLKDFINMANESHINEVKTLIAKLKSAYTDSDFDPVVFKALDLQMHQLWFDITDHSYLWNKIILSDAHYTRFCMLDMLQGENYEYVISEHELILSAIITKSTDKIENLIKAHLNGGLERLDNMDTNLKEAYFIS